MIKLAVQKRGFRIRALRSDSTTRQADIRYPTDSGLAAAASKALARAARQLRGLGPELTRTVPGRSRAVNKLLRALTRSLRSGTGEPKEQVQRLTEQIAAQARMAVGQAQRLLEEATTSCQAGSQPAGRAVTGAINRLRELVFRSRRIVVCRRDYRQRLPVRRSPIDSSRPPRSRRPTSFNRPIRVGHQVQCKNTEAAGLASVKGGYPGPQVGPMYPLAG